MTKRIAGWKLLAETPTLKDKIGVVCRIDFVDGCWFWTGHKTTDGYGEIGRAKVLVHRLTYVWTRGPIADGLVIDHLCRNRRCINPDHLRAVTLRDNVLAEGSLAPAAFNHAKGACKRGHELTEENTYFYVGKKSGHLHRTCRICQSATVRRYKQRKGSVSP